jgi:hypothetical protein
MERINVIDAEIGDIAVITRFGGGGNGGAAAKHESDMTCAAETPIAGDNVVEFASKTVRVPHPGAFQVVNHEDRI